MAIIKSFVMVQAELANGESYTAPVIGFEDLQTPVIYPITGGKTLRIDLYNFDIPTTPGIPTNAVTDNGAAITNAGATVTMTP